MGSRYIAVAVAFIISLLIVSPLFSPESQEMNSTSSAEYWLGVAISAWQYFQPGIGVNIVTGLHSAGLGYPYFTDWDLGVYIQAIIAACKVGILNDNGEWGANARFDKVLRFLETRSLTSYGTPYVWYDSRNGNNYGNEAQNAADTGKLLVSLKNLEVYRPDLAERIDHIVYNRVNYESLEEAVDVLNVSSNIYDYYVASGFAGFWAARFSPVANLILNNIVLAPAVQTYGVALPESKLSCEPLIQSVLELQPDLRLLNLSAQVYLAHEARYNATGKYTAFSEGNTGLSEISYLYEWVVLPDGQTWVLQNGQISVEVTPIIYLKTAIGFLAIYNTSFAQNMVDYVISNLPSSKNGYADGIDENGRVVTSIIDKTNGLILEAAAFAINELHNPSSSATPKPVVIPSSSPFSTPTTTDFTTTSTPSPTSFLSSTATPSAGLQSNRIGFITIVFLAAVACAFFLLLAVFLLKRHK